MKLKARLSLLGLVLVFAATALLIVLWPRGGWSDSELATLRELWIGSLPTLPADPSNAVADKPQAVKLGHSLFFDTRFSANGAISCASCHLPQLNFQDGKPLAQGIGTTSRKTMSIVGAAYSPWLFWDGRKDSLWAQALGPLENPVEHGGTRTQYAQLISRFYRSQYEALFGPLPDLSDTTRFPEIAAPVADPAARAAWERMAPGDRELVTRIYANMGKAIAAYERQILPGPARFDRYVAALLAKDEAGMRTALNAAEVAGLRLFINKAQCINCHNGPLFTSSSFHNNGVPAVPGKPADRGRASGAPQVLADEFNCLSRWSDARAEDCGELRFMVPDGEGLEGAFKPPTLRNIAASAPYMHAGQFATLQQVVQHYSAAPAAATGHTEVHPLHLSAAEVNQLVAFLGSLSGPLDTPEELLRPPADIAANRP